MLNSTVSSRLLSSMATVEGFQHEVCEIIVSVEDKTLQFVVYCMPLILCIGDFDWFQMDGKQIMWETNKGTHCTVCLWRSNRYISVDMYREQLTMCRVGFMYGSTVLDKDGISSLVAAAEYATSLYKSGSNFAEELQKIYQKYVWMYG